MIDLEGLLKELEEDPKVTIQNKCIEIRSKNIVIKICRDNLRISGSGVEVYLKKRLRGAQKGYVDLVFGEAIASEEKKKEVVTQVVSLVRSLLCS